MPLSKTCLYCNNDSGSSNNAPWYYDINYSNGTSVYVVWGEFTCYEICQLTWLFRKSPGKRLKPLDETCRYVLLMGTNACCLWSNCKPPMQRKVGWNKKYYLCLRLQNIMKMERKEYFEKVMQTIISTAMVVACASIVKMRQYVIVETLTFRKIKIEKIL